MQNKNKKGQGLDKIRKILSNIVYFGLIPIFIGIFYYKKEIIRQSRTRASVLHWILVILILVFVSNLPLLRLTYAYADDSFSTQNLNISFTSQAPDGNWAEPWQNSCEEASIVMVDSFYADKIITQDFARRKILEILRIKDNYYGPSLDEGSGRIIQIINNFLPWEAREVEDPTIEQIKLEIDQGHPVIAPVYGKALMNPNFQGNGPDYHTVVISGYDDETHEFITQEPGTQFGQNYRYSYKVVMNALHDFVPNGRMVTGKKVAIFTQQQISNSGQLDGDLDGLTKIQEIMHKTVLWLTDSDGDSYSDGTEVKAGYSPIISSKKNLISRMWIELLIKQVQRQYIIKNEILRKQV